MEEKNNNKGFFVVVVPLWEMCWQDEDGSNLSWHSRVAFLWIQSMFWHSQSGFHGSSPCSGIPRGVLDGSNLSWHS